MKQIKGTNQRWTMKSILSLAGMLAVAMSFAIPAQAGPAQFNRFQQQIQPHVNIPVTRQPVRIQWPPDLQVRVWLDTSSIRKSNPRCAQGCSWDYTIRGSVKNVGRGAFVPLSNNAQTLNLYGPVLTSTSRPRLIQSWAFGRLNPGQSKNVSVHLRMQPGPSIEFVTDYKMNIVFGPDSPGDRNRRNNQATLRRSTVVSAIDHNLFPDLIPVVSHPFDGFITVKNIGTATAGASRIEIEYRNASVHLDGFAPDHKVIYIHALTPGQLQRVRFPGWSGAHWTPGVYNFTVLADAFHRVVESDERNNKVGTAMKVATLGKRPDLIPVVSHPFNGVITVKNIGNATAGASRTEIEYRNASVHFGPDRKIIYIHALPPGQFQQVSFPGWSGAHWDPGVHNFTVMADSDHRVVESDEHNNVARTAMTVRTLRPRKGR